MRATEKKQILLRFPKNAHSVPPARPIQPLEQRETFNVLFCDSPSRKAEKQRGIHYSVSIRIGQEEESG
ncbi:hypothetical protein NEUTE1DRAFT_139360 [Neurospora tetrasperma FGSC 2508]|uniref:Uncharacterized protein n=1 Tax=Neurospora tetrasperma (strain FGSC 2508 / ATCC MYA-4615 / P0657) TaxID=510951 RepID=F8MSJ6_NEUT8|nr:uncharacterized protein NEUTE1DRAFT_139360 [Neurospora tetrasperma FGSC 2508]EGO55083.1 hypothetical protein NEUTE1DRAFT_139360 [Neurospora tetrasperma FGSC 2508]EGZ69710.1 hypothetical protein NEUTE2DRAFT_169295 [Neurospora tetrasperma FGSC 2509]